MLRTLRYGGLSTRCCCSIDQFSAVSAGTVAARRVRPPSTASVCRVTRVATSSWQDDVCLRSSRALGPPLPQAAILGIEFGGFQADPGHRGDRRPDQLARRIFCARGCRRRGAVAVGSCCHANGASCVGRPCWLQAARCVGIFATSQLCTLLPLASACCSNFICTFTYISFHLARRPTPHCPPAGSVRSSSLISSVRALHPWTAGRSAGSGLAPVHVGVIAIWLVGIALTLAPSLFLIVAGLALGARMRTHMPGVSTGY
jgi:hypothetical protein